MQFPIDTSTFTFLVSSAPRAVTKFGTDEIKTKDGQPLYAVELIAMGDSGADKLNVKVAGRPELQVRGEVRVSGLMAMPWETNGKSGVSFSAERIESVAKAKAA